MEAFLFFCAELFCYPGIDWYIKRTRSAFMASLSLCMIVKNEEDVLGRCLESVKDLADEIIIVDTGVR